MFILCFESTTNQAVCSVIPKPIYQYFNYYYLQTMEEYYVNQAVGSAQQNISKLIVE
ncbi:restriction endonuclease subunit S, partial [Rodentibacter mrazii]|uniref:restriction endonuclease subunit S n=1 Tax=Rodentibacter mrazii TaxID=1908257 RepID=UPI003CC66C21